MASKEYIFQAEKSIKDECADMEGILKEYKKEKEENRGNIKRENRDFWGTLYMNAVAKRPASNRLVAEMQKDFH